MTPSENGLYQPGQSLLHNLDPRLKVLACLLMVSLVFAADWEQLVVLAVIIALGLCTVSAAAGPVWRACWMLRWFMLFTLLMHLLFTPGRTLWGLSWLSFDGLLMGGQVCTQMLLAITLSALLAITTSADVLTRTFGWFVQPLQWLGFRTGEWQKILLLAMDFIPVVRSEIDASKASDGADAAGSRAGRWTLWTERLHGFLLRLVDRGDTIAHRMAAEEETLSLPIRLAPLMPLALHDQLFSWSIALMIVCYWLAG